MKAKQKGISTERINDAKNKIKEYNKITKNALAIQPFMEFDGASIQFNDKAAEKNGVSKQLIESTKSDVSKINSYVEKEKHNTDDGLVHIAACSGASKFVDTWNGYDTYFDSCETTKIIGYLTIGAGVATIAAAVAAFIFPPAGLAAGIAAGLMGIGAGALTVASAEGCGTKVKWMFDQPFWTGSQC
ncbi:hypothetical protein [Bacillus sp. T33-2]|uniref:hypothetical protein n=1 Tax=Bacillus sp. T33-2 TaxID=2054168 RepID=UPI000C775255|nr:hypothetical protein [Bacillus sp. T33-2]PLR91936.1 hypothetical protein CVD19_21340 [Bacillus sp. T33-2]